MSGAFWANDPVVKPQAAGGDWWKNDPVAKPQAPQQETAAPPQPGQAPWAESVFGQLDQPTGNLLLDTVREYPYQVESGVRSGLQMAGHGGQLAGVQGDPAGIVGMLAGSAGALSAPVSAAFGPISRPVHDWIGNPVEKVTGGYLPADVVTAGALALPGAFKLPGGPRVNEPAPPRTQVGRLSGGERGEAQRTGVLGQMQQAKADAYRRSEQAGVIIKPDAVRAAEDAIAAELADESYKHSRAPDIKPILDDLADITGGRKNVTLKGLDTIRKGVVDVARDFNNPTQQRLAGIILDHLDSMPLADSDVIVPRGVDPLQAVQDLRQGRSIAKAQFKADKIDQALTIAKDRADRTGSGANIENTIRQEIGKILDRVTKKKDKSWTPNEILQMRMVVRGGNINNLLRFVGKFSPEHPLYAMLAAIGAGGVVGGPAGAGLGAAIAGTGALSKLSSEAINRYRANELFNTVARGQAPRQIGGRPGGAPGAGPQGPIIPPAPQPPRPGSPLSSTMYSNPLDPAAIRQLFFKGKPPPPAPPQQGITAYHGSPHDFNRFDMSKIGTGEGAQAFGHGLYFAENEGVAAAYRNTLSGNRQSLPHLDGKPMPETPPTGRVQDLTPEQNATFELSVSPSVDAALHELQVLSQGRTPAIAKVAHHYKAAYDWLKANQSRITLTSDTRKGKTYQVRIDAAPHEFLDWDKPLSQQSPMVRQAVQQFPKEFRMLRDPTGQPAPQYGEPFGHEFYKKVASDVPQHKNFNTRNAAQATDRLRAAGIKGIRYKDAGSRGGESGTYNYVIFDDKLISILKKYAIPMTVTAGGVLVSGANLPPDIKAQIEASGT